MDIYSNISFYQDRSIYRHDMENFWKYSMLKLGMAIIILGVINFKFNSYLILFVENYLSSDHSLADTTLEMLKIIPHGLCFMGGGLILLHILKELSSRFKDFLKNIISLAKEIEQHNRVEFYTSLVSFLIITVFIIYSGTLNFFFSMDDFSLLINSRINEMKDFWGFFTAKPIFENFYRPITTYVYFSLGRKFFGLTPIGFRVSNLAFHLFNGFLVYYLAYILSKENILGIIATLIFITRVSIFRAVFWVAGIQDLLATFFVLLTLICYVRAEKNRRNFYLAVLFFVISLLSKESAIVLPGVILVYELLYKRKRINLVSLREIIKKQFLFYLISMGWFLAKLSYIPSSFYSKGRYRMAFGNNVPSNLIRFSLFSFNGIFDCLIPVAILFTVLACHLARRAESSKLQPLVQDAKLVYFGFSFFLIFLLPVIPIWFMQKYFLYLPIIGFSIAMAYFVNYIYKNTKHILPNLGLILLIVFITSTILVSAQKTWAMINMNNFMIREAVIAENYVKDLKRIVPELPKECTLCFIPKEGTRCEEGLINCVSRYTANGEAFKLFYENSKMNIIYLDNVTELEKIPAKNLYAFLYDKSHLYKLPAQNAKENSLKLINQTSPGMVIRNGIEKQPVSPSKRSPTDV